MVLLDQDLSVLSVPCACPVLVRPAETEREIRLTRSENLIEWAIEQAPAIEPVVVVAEARNPMLSRELGLSLANFGHAEVVESEIGWQVGLVVSSKQRPGLHHVRPFREPPSPPPVVLGDGVELRKIEREQSNRRVPNPRHRFTQGHTRSPRRVSIREGYRGTTDASRQAVRMSTGWGRTTDAIETFMVPSSIDRSP